MMSQLMAGPLADKTCLVFMPLAFCLTRDLQSEPQDRLGGRWGSLFVPLPNVAALSKSVFRFSL